MEKPVLVIKLGSAIITREDGTVHKALIKKMAAGIAALNRDYRLILVSSGAVSSGKSFLKNYKASLTEKKAAAAIGNPLLIALYQKFLQKDNITVAQVLCERHHFSNRFQFVQLRETFHEFWKNNVLPVVNENDLVSNVELKFSDNDELATLLSIAFDASKMILCTTAGGLKNTEGEIVPVITEINEKVMSWVTPDRSASGLGGMLSKLTCTRLATTFGIRVVFCGLQGEQALQNAVMEKSGTCFHEKPSNLRARQKWLVSGSITLGSITVDKGAEKALALRKSLLSVGLTAIAGKFSKGEVVQLVNEEGKIFGVARMKMSANELLLTAGQKNSMAAHADDIVLF